MKEDKVPDFGKVPDNLIHFVPKGWGWESWLVNNDMYCGKILFIKQGKQFSWHYHNVKSETFFIQEGRVYVYYGWDDNLSLSSRAILKKGDVFNVPVGLRHRLFAYEDTYVIEFSTHHEDSDSIRLIKGD